MSNGALRSVLRSTVRGFEVASRPRPVLPLEHYPFSDNNVFLLELDSTDIVAFSSLGSRSGSQGRVYRTDSGCGAVPALLGYAVGPVLLLVA